MNTTIFKAGNKEEWLEKRSKGLGGTDISAILGVNKYKTPYQVWEDKTGRAPKFEGNKFTRRGQYMEDAVTNYFEDATGQKVIRASESSELFIHADHPFLLGSPDRRYFAAEGGKGVLECKTTMNSMEADLEAIPQAWFIQLQWYLGLAGYKKGTIAWGELGWSTDFKHIEVDFNPDFFNYMVEEGVKFWNNHIVTDTAPEATTSSDIERLYTSHAANKYISASDEFLKIYQELKSMKEKKKLLDEQMEEKEEALKLALGDAEGARYEEEILVTWKTTKPSLKFDDKAFKAAEPSIWMKYTKETSCRRFLLK